MRKKYTILQLHKEKGLQKSGYTEYGSHLGHALVYNLNKDSYLEEIGRLEFVYWFAKHQHLIVVVISAMIDGLETSIKQKIASDHDEYVAKKNI